MFLQSINQFNHNNYVNSCQLLQATEEEEEDVEEREDTMPEDNLLDWGIEIRRVIIRYSISILDVLVV